MWCKVMHAMRRIAVGLQESQPSGVRLSVTIPAADYDDLRRSAADKRVSLAWVIRDAIGQYLRDQAPLLRHE
jgi:hypothetical protein